MLTTSITSKPIIKKGERVAEVIPCSDGTYTLACFTQNGQNLLIECICKSLSTATALALQFIQGEELNDFN